MSFHTTDLCDAHPDVVVPLFDYRFFGQKRSFCGPIATVQVFEDNVLVRQALETLPAGTLLVVDGGGSRRCALLGDRLAAIALERELAGVIINGCVRDAAELATMDVGVVALGTHPRKSNKHGTGQADVVLSFGEALWHPGAFAYVDADGIVLAPQPLL